MITLLKPGALQALPPLSLYIHLPWCLRKCPYCDFNSHQVSTTAGNTSRLDEATERRYLEALCADLESALPQIWGRRVHTIFMGGGTPSLFSPEGLDRLLADVRARLPLEPNCEITLEANPGTFEKDRFRAFRQAGVNRLSIGVQSFDDAKLKALGRVHSGDQARAAIAEAASCFDTFNIDLMYALPGQTMVDLQQDVQTALSFAPPHLSLYHLTLEPNTAFATRPPPDLPDEDTAFDMLDHLIEQTNSAGMQRYEISAYAKPGHACQHNLNYWQFGDYLGIGAGAHSKISFPDRIVRQVRWREPATYMDKALSGQACSNEHDIDLQARAFEYMMNALRLKDGFELSRFQERTGLTLASIQQPLAKAESMGLLARDLTHAWPTERGFDFLSDLQALFLQD
ncbi:MAG: oxygen-independent coproporphyrinogen III oxidase-like protein [Burkholderiales bacterium]|nr:oxygen-independent coproporphyrinogen III oxidase-like protein [Burkholderiales bacterium]MDE2078468.1 oxygen-independent coproporphyrinogen III oxidase-like protein [Burkholderiales bacterium]MDE2432226.1 oxygen-independent coproporphyrinogen III oxidase-like protein [Burkholderiales bacterium]HET8694483.1 radical SAM family heme chaperone HemW [Aquabacterium sp.]